jgi:hypothetical protein
MKLTFTNSEGKSFVMAKTFPNILTSHKGLSANGIESMTAKGFNQNGVYYQGVLEEERIINLNVKYNYETKLQGEQRRKDIISIFNPNIGLGELVYEDETGTYKISAVVSAKPQIYPLPRLVSVSEFDVILMCPKPDWLSYTPFQVKMTGLTGGLKYPKKYPIRFAKRGNGGEVDYKGDNPASMILDFRVKPGGTSVVDPMIVNGKGKYIKIKKTIGSNERLLVDTNMDSPSVIFEDANGNQTDAWDDAWVFGSTPMQLHRGLNTFKFYAASGNPECYLTAYNHYAGV